MLLRMTEQGKILRGKALQKDRGRIRFFATLRMTVRGRNDRAGLLLRMTERRKSYSVL